RPGPRVRTTDSVLPLCTSSAGPTSTRMTGGDKGLLNFHLNLCHHLHRKQGGGGGVKDVPKGCLAIKVGQGEDQQRFIVPVLYFNHPLFMRLLKEAEEEYGFDQKGTITIPCHVEEFRYVQGIIDKERSLDHHHDHHHHRPISACFKA
ncbi:Auxin-responsive protein saur32, partial [Ancistrocladus abbreviatus]